jgi:hypothetical protein
LLEDNAPAAPTYAELDGGMNEVFLARFSDRLTLSRRIGLDLAQHPVELLMAAYRRMVAFDRADGGGPHASHLPQVEGLDMAMPAVRRADEAIE